MPGEDVTRSAPPQTLTYAPRQGRLRRRMIHWLVFVVVLATVVAGYHWRAIISYRALEYYHFRRALNHVTPPGTHIVVQDKDRAKALIDGNPDYVDPRAYTPRSPQNRVYSMRPLIVPVRTTAIYVPVVLRNLETYVDTLAGPVTDFAAVFVGERRTPSGKRRLVIIRGSSTAEELFFMRGNVIEPPSLTHLAIAKQLPAIPLSGGSYLVSLQPGVADPADPSHLTIAYVSRDPATKGMIDVYLREDDVLTFKARAPTTRPS